MATVDINDEIVRAAQTFRRARMTFAGGDRRKSTVTAYDLAAHSLAALLVDRVLDADANEFLEELGEARDNRCATELDGETARRASGGRR